MSEHPDGPRYLRPTGRPWSKHIVSFFLGRVRTTSDRPDLGTGSLEEIELDRLGWRYLKRRSVSVASMMRGSIIHARSNGGNSFLSVRPMCRRNSPD